MLGVIPRRKPLPAAAPQTDPRFKKVMENLKQGAARIRHHAPASRKAAEASAAAKGPPNERAAAGKSAQVDRIQGAPSKEPKPASFLEVLQAEIAKAMPKTLADTEKFMKGGSSGELKGSLKGNVSKQKDEAAGATKSASTEAPKETGAAKESTPIPGEPAAASPNVNAGEGMPAPKTDGEVSLQDSKQDTEQQMKDADVTTPQLQKANDPRFSSVVESKDQVAKQADAAPAQYRASEKGILSQAAAQAKGTAVKGAAAMVHVRGGSNSAVLSKQAAAKARDEAKRKEVTDHIEQIYNRTKASVEAKLNSLETDVNAMFDTGTDAALKAMTDYVEARIDAYKDERYSGLLGAGRWIRDKFKGLPDEANVFYEEGRAKFTRMMNALVVKVAAIVEQRLKEAKDEVAKGQAEIKAYVASQPKELKAVAEKAQKDVTDRFAELERSIDDKKQQLAEQLAQKYKEGFDKANESLKKIQDANKGLIAGFIEKLVAVVKAIIEFKNKLMAVLRKGAEAIKLIIADPIGFLGNLLSAIKKGFSQFADNIWTHLKAGFMKWLFGALAETGIEIPTDLSLPSILKLVLAVLGITYERMRAKAVKLVGERAVKFIEKLVEYIKVLFTGGFAALWEKVKEDLSNLKEMVIDAIQDWLITTIVKKAVMKIASMFNPVGAIVQAILAIVDVVMFVIEKANQILEFITAVVESISAIAMGQIQGAANWIEKSLANMIPLLIGFLAQLLGLGGISKKIKETILKVQNAVDKAIDKAIAKIVAVVKKLVGGATAAVKGAAAKVVAFLFPKKSLMVGNEKHVMEAKPTGATYVILVHSPEYTVESFISFADQKAKEKSIKGVESKTKDLKTKYQAWEQKLGKAQEAANEGQPPASKDYLEKEYGAIGDLIQVIWGMVRDVDQPSVIQWGPRTAAGGTWVVANPLTSQHGEGAAPGSTTWGLWEKVKPGILKRDKKGLYVRGHLLNRLLGGPNTVENLTPITYSANATHESKVESDIKDLLKDKKKKTMVYYKVAAVYPGAALTVPTGIEPVEGQLPLRLETEWHQLVPSASDPKKLEKGASKGGGPISNVGGSTGYPHD